MPLYEYHCLKCDKTFEVMQKFSDAPLTEHEGCGGALEKLLSAPAFQLKGSGWYITDYARKPESKGDGSSGEKTAAKSEPKADAKTDSKSESKTESSKKETSSDTKPAAKAD